MASSRMDADGERASPIVEKDKKEELLFFFHLRWLADLLV